MALTTASAALTPAQLNASWSIGLALSIVFVVVSRRSSRASWQALLLVKGELPLPIALLAGIAIALALDVAVGLASGAFIPVPMAWRAQSGGALGLLVAALLLVVLQPLAETLAIQAVLLPRLRSSFGHWRGLLGASAIYAALYQLVYVAPYAFYDMIWHGMVFPAGMALSFCLLRVYARSSLAALLGRMGAGLIMLLTALVIQSR